VGHSASTSTKETPVSDLVFERLADRFFRPVALPGVEQRDPLDENRPVESGDQLSHPDRLAHQR
jgi:hypothetical protein